MTHIVVNDFDKSVANNYTNRFPFGAMDEVFVPAVENLGHVLRQTKETTGKRFCVNAAYNLKGD